MAYQIQTSLFTSQQEDSTCEPDVTYIPAFVENHQHWFEHLRTSLNWNCQYKSRKTVSFGVSYNDVTGVKKVGEIPEFLDPVCSKILQTFQYKPNNCLVNYYPDGRNYISFHSDQVDEMKANTGVTIISLGDVRNMILRNINDNAVKFYYPLQPGSGFFMKDELHSEWQHGILKESTRGPRISLSFRCLID